MKTIQLYVSNTASGVTNAALSYTFTIKGKIVSVQWILAATAGATPGYQMAELSFTPTSQNQTNDAAGVVSSVVNNTPGAASSYTTQNQLFVGLSQQINVGDRIYINCYNANALNSGTVKAILTIQ